MTTTGWQQLLLCITWVWPVMTIAHLSSAGSGDVGGAVFWGLVWCFCAVRLHAKGRWPFAPRTDPAPATLPETSAQRKERLGSWVERTRDPLDDPGVVDRIFKRVDELRVERAQKKSTGTSVP